MNRVMKLAGGRCNKTTYLLTIRALLVTVLALQMKTATAEEIFFDDFRDGDIQNDTPVTRDGVPVRWDPLTVLPGDYDVTHGDLTFTPPAGGAQNHRMAAIARDLDLSDVSIRAQVTKLQDTPNFGEWISISGRVTPADPGSSVYAGYEARIDTADNLQLYQFGPTGSETIGSFNGHGFDITGEDVLLQLDAIGDRLKVWAWRPGDIMPADPQIDVVDTTHASGTVSVLSTDGPGDSVGVFRFVQVADSPQQFFPSNATRWTSEGTFDASALPAGSAFNTFSASSALDLVDVQFNHTVAGNEDLSELTLNEGAFKISAANGDQLNGTYEDFVYSLDDSGEKYDGVGQYTFTGGTGMFATASGGGSWSAVAAFTSDTGGTADHQWTSDLNLSDIPVEWTSEGTFDASALPAGSALNNFSSSSAFRLGDVDFSHTVEANEDLSVLTLNGGTFSIAADNGDELHGTYEDFVYSLGDDGQTYDGVGDFTFTGGTGMFSNASGDGTWNAIAAFTSATGGTADHNWTGTLNLSSTLTGDFQSNGVLDAEDINLLLTESASGTNNPKFDLNGDSVVNTDDVKVWVKDVKNTWIGDANLDGEFNSGDLTAVFQTAKYELDENAGWQEGDWNGDRRFDTSDLTAAFQDAGYEQGPRAAVAAVPEPASFLMLAGGLIGLTAGHRRRAGR